MEGAGAGAGAGVEVVENRGSCFQESLPLLLLLLAVFVVVDGMSVEAVLNSDFILFTTASVGAEDGSVRFMLTLIKQHLEGCECASEWSAACVATCC